MHGTKKEQFQPVVTTKIINDCVKRYYMLLICKLNVLIPTHQTDIATTDDFDTQASYT